MRAAIELGPSHLSWYQLTLEPNTVFYARPPEDLPDEETAYEIQDAGAGAAARRRLRAVRGVGLARDGRRCRHNLNYWLFGDYLAAGAGAHGKLSTRDGVFRYRKAGQSTAVHAGDGGGLAGGDDLNPVAG